MAIQTGKYILGRDREATSKSIAEQLSKASAGEEKRKGRSGLFGKIGGFFAGEALNWGVGLALTALTGGMAAGPILTALKTLQKGGKYAKLLKTGLKGAGMFAGKAAAHQATTGKWGERLKTSGQVGEITADSKYGYGREEAKSLSEELERSRESEQDWGTFAGDVAGAYASDFAGQSLGDIFGGADIGSNVTEMSDELVTDYLRAPVTEPIKNLPMQQGGEVPDQEELLMLLSLIESQNQKAHDDTPLEEARPTISEYFKTQNKTIGGSNIQSLSQTLGR